MSNDTSDIPIMVPSQTFKPEPLNVSTKSEPYANEDVIGCLMKGGVPSKIAHVLATSSHNDCSKGLQTYREHSSSNGKGFVKQSADWWPHGSLDIQGGGKLKKRTRKCKSKKRKERSKKRKKVKKTKYLKKKVKKSRKNKKY